MDHELHWAAQLASAPATTLLEAKPDASHTNLGWDWKARALAGHPVSGRRAALRLTDATLLVLDDASTVTASLPLRGETIASSLAWLARAFEVSELRRPEHDLPAHPVGDGAPLTVTDGAELAMCFAFAQNMLDPVARREKGSPVRCWPHHFDIATLISLEGDRSIGVGMSPGDASYARPYFYVTPWPYPPPDRELPALASGTWHREGWTGAVFVLGAEDARVRDFLNEAIPAARQSLQSSV